MKEFWNERYARTEFAYGKEPNAFFRSQLSKLQAGSRLLFPAEGEGRNAVYAATMGMEVTAFDTSEEGKRKSELLADEFGVSIDYRTGGMETVWGEPYFDAVVLIYAHFSPDLLSSYHRKMIEKLKSGGLVILEAFSKSHLEFSRKNPEAGGPKNIDMLFDLEMVNKDFPNFKSLLLEEAHVNLNEGIYHRGKSAVVRFVGEKP